MSEHDDGKLRWASTHGATTSFARIYIDGDGLMWKETIIVLLVFLASGCGHILGIEKDYVLRKPIPVEFGEEHKRVVIPAGTRIKCTCFKEDIAFIEVYGETSRSLLDDTGETK